MAEAREGGAGAGSLEAELTCPVCLGLYQEPMSLSCGHNLCLRCLEAMLDSQRLAACPTCRASLGPSVQLHRNYTLGSIVEAFEADAGRGQQARAEGQQEGAPRGEPGAVPCEHCLDGPRPAVKTCLVCEASLCQAHLDKHNARGFHQEHILVEVGAGEARERRCRDHGRLLECYCLREERCICVLCSISRAHRGHEVIAMKEGHDRKLVKLSNTVTELQKSKSILVTALEKLQESENQIKNNTKTVTSQVEELFESTKTELDKRKSCILSHLQASEEAELAVIANKRKKMEHKRNQAEQNLQALQKIKEQPDVFLFLRDLKLVTDRIASLDLGAEGVVVKEVQLNKGAINQYKSWRSKLLMQLEYLLEDSHGNVRQLSGAQQEKITAEDSFMYLLENFYPPKPRHKGDTKTRSQN